MQPVRLSKEQFLLSMELSPRMVVELIVENSDHATYFLMREGEPYKGSWHLPGGFLLKNEKIEGCVYRLLADECDISEKLPYSFDGFYETVGEDPRGHILHYVVRFESEECPVEGGKREYLTDIPENIIPYQRKFFT